jgi:hypothetical protein
LVGGGAVFSDLMSIDLLRSGSGEYYYHGVAAFPILAIFRDL